MRTSDRLLRFSQGSRSSTPALDRRARGVHRRRKSGDVHRQLFEQRCSGLREARLRAFRANEERRRSAVQPDGDAI